jgi:hypothetical protein
MGGDDEGEHGEAGVSRWSLVVSCESPLVLIIDDSGG